MDIREHEEKKEERLERLKRSFNYNLDNEAIWYGQAENLKAAADEICWLDENHEDRSKAHHLGNTLKFLIGTYRMLLGLAFENLLKGLLIAQGVSAGEDGKLFESFTTHKINQLLAKLDTAKFPLNKEERKLLMELEEHVLWGGRYPLPKKYEDLHLPGHGNADHRREQELWSRMVSYMKEVGTIKSFHGTGERIPFSRE